ncbi:hypothetical protein [Sphingomonas panacis]|uniref:hypothetical protein n=1 Tax=Sphingomonas panacis TaxID=1560345 RepID=UPI0019CF745F|nr:hypothetical protein [Sphingomonas panacis]
MSEKPSGSPAPKAFDLLASLAAFAQANRIALNDPTLIDRFMADARPKLETALADMSLVHGSRTERLFEATVLTLGRFKMFKTEDIGRVHGAMKAGAPDFRVVLNDGEQWLIEVKNVRSQKPLKQSTTMSAAYLRSLQSMRKWSAHRSSSQSSGRSGISGRSCRRSAFAARMAACA